jgi:hypothetical protein
MDVIRRFPSKEKMLALQVLGHEVKDKAGIAIDSVMMATCLYLVETNRADEIDAYMKWMQEKLDHDAEWYEDAIAEGLQGQLHELGIEYRR